MQAQQVIQSRLKAHCIEQADPVWNNTVDVKEEDAVVGLNRK